MPITVFSNNGKAFTKIEHVEGLEHTEGMWNRIKSADLDRDGDLDFILGNLGQNSRLQASAERPLFLKVNDFDRNGSMEPIFIFEKDGKEFPLALRQDLVKQMSSLKKKFLFYKDYAGKPITEIFDPQLLEQATTLKIQETRSCVLMNAGSQSFQLRPLPDESQVSPVYGITVEDINKDGRVDILLGGNLFAVKPEIGRYDALHGQVLLGNGKGDFKSLPSRQSGFQFKGEIRHLGIIKNKTTKILAAVRNNDAMRFYSIQR
jgi:hypothetical protein